jgi:hypothetical protein
MVDHPEKAARLLAALKAAAPFKIEPGPLLVKRLRAKGVAAANAPEHTVTDLSHAGDKGGIVCRIKPSGFETALLVSLIHVVIHRSTPLARNTGKETEAARADLEPRQSPIPYPAATAERFSAKRLLQRLRQIAPKHPCCLLPSQKLQSPATLPRFRL